jgi:hypothetical protein
LDKSCLDKSNSDKLFIATRDTFFVAFARIKRIMDLKQLLTAARHL